MTDYERAELEEIEREQWMREYYGDDYYTPSATFRDYGPGNPWDAPGMSIHDFI